MEKLYINKIKELVNKLKKDNGWTDLAKLGKALNEIGLNYKALGYLKLKNLFDEDQPAQCRQNQHIGKSGIFARKRIGFIFNFAEKGLFGQNFLKHFWKDLLCKNGQTSDPDQ